MVGQVCIIQTTLPGSWLEAEVGALCHNKCWRPERPVYNIHQSVQFTVGRVKPSQVPNGILQIESDLIKRNNSHQYPRTTASV